MEDLIKPLAHVVTNCQWRGIFICPDTLTWLLNEWITSGNTLSNVLKCVYDLSYYIIFRLSSHITFFSGKTRHTLSIKTTLFTWTCIVYWTRTTYSCITMYLSACLSPARNGRALVSVRDAWADGHFYCLWQQLIVFYCVQTYYFLS